MITPAYSPTATERVLPRLALDFTTASLDSRVTITRALNTATRVNSSGYIETVNANLPRFDYDPITLAPKGLLIELTRANLLIRSAEFDNAGVWFLDAATVSPNVSTETAPDGTTSADKLVENLATSAHDIYQAVGTSQPIGTYTYSMYVKASGRTKFRLQQSASTSYAVLFDLTALTATTVVGGATGVVTPAGNNWYRCSMTYTTVSAFAPLLVLFLANAAGSVSYQGDGTSGVFMWGAQLEAGAFATSYIPTTTTSLTRNADDVNMTGTNFSDWYNASEGTISFEGSIFVDQGSTTVNFTQMSNGVSNAVSIDLIMFTAAAPALQVSNSGTQCSIDTGALTLNTVFKMVGAYKANSFVAALNGGTPGTDSTGTIPTVSQMGIGNRLSGPYMNGHARKIQYWPQRLLNAEVQAFSK